MGFAVENYGTDPDIEVEILPQDWANGLDPQIDRAIEIALADLNMNPPIKPDFTDRPNLSRPVIGSLKPESKSKQSLKSKVSE